MSDILLVRAAREADHAEWRGYFAEFLPELDCRWWDDPSVDPARVAYAFVWEPEPGRLARYPGLRLICSVGAGVDHIVNDPDWPRHVPVARMGNADGTQRMGEYVAWACLGLLRGARRMALAQAERRWRFFLTERAAPEVTVGILGLGNMGARTAAMLQGLGFRTRGWSRTAKSLAAVESFVGDEALDRFLAGTDMLVSLLPDTPGTRGLIDARRLALLPQGAAVIGAGRGSTIVLDDLIAALDGGHLSGAVLDVFPEEPLPPEHAAWAHPKITVTPHIGSIGARRERARYVADAIRAQAAGGAVPNLYDPARGY